MLLNHDIEKDKILYPHYSNTYTFIVCHKPFEDKFGDISNKVYLTDFKDYAKSSGALLVNSDYDSRVFGEITFLDYIYKTIRDYDWACLCAYRRKIYPKIGIQVAHPIKFPCSVLQHLTHYHSRILTDALTKALPKEELGILESNLFVPFNIFSAPRQVIGDWLGFVIPRVEQTMQILGCPQDIDGVKEWVKQTDLLSPADGKNLSIDYQARIGAFLSERINTIFWLTRNYRTTIPRSQVVRKKPIHLTKFIHTTNDSLNFILFLRTDEHIPGWHIHPGFNKYIRCVRKP